MKNQKKAYRFPKSGKRTIKIADMGVLKIHWNPLEVDRSRTEVNITWVPVPTPVTEVMSCPTKGNVAGAVVKSINVIFDDVKNDLPAYVRTGRPFVFGELTRALK